MHLDGSIEPAELFAIAKACAIDGVVVSGGSLPARLFKSRLTTGRYMEVFFQQAAHVLSKCDQGHFVASQLQCMLPRFAKGLHSATARC